MQFKVHKDGKWKNKGRRVDIFFNTTSNLNLLEYLHESLKKMEFGGQILLFFSKAEEAAINRRSATYLPESDDRPAIFLNCILSRLKETWNISMFATYVTTNPAISIAHAHPHQVRLAIQFERQKM
ncbi:MAG: hypothetical protein PHP62_03645 [Candidatus Moranbacteria bacterium]|nr:hypothetical protein [Candidatus Moranbacteria bacterium]